MTQISIPEWLLLTRYSLQNQQKKMVVSLFGTIMTQAHCKSRSDLLQRRDKLPGATLTQSFA
ncbi:hypothetical protein RO3G_00410 [Rhizopus delemar RA 99-880]|uniref:Uncharacterized protein n=1 Tax=Rhizopus delemar (strain RA 99-880 / ATCC MYA-4621 / FGSC 9543 / NRRL 43880) TaxID=246409 RepID=I1BHM6_RHIO9|nr:hypothetical protein RO3G_00410 [Rhizopus delemar RA 99-880]|eukprot:EIE75706.1 hypothetical protein RO3G_00410 [Rhizopus delemar RA 99-880]